MKPRIAVEDFVLEQLIFEARFPTAYQLWDKAGALSEALGTTWPSLALLTAQPGNVAFRVGKSATMFTELTRAGMTLFYPGSKPDVQQISEFFDHVREHMQLTVLQRLGLRFLLFREFADQASGALAMLETGLLTLPSDRFFGAEGTPKSAEVMISVEGKGLTATFRMGVQTRQVSIDLPANAPPHLHDTHESTHGLFLDVDFFTPMEVQVTQLGMSDWIEQVMHVFKRDVPKLL